MPTPDGRTPERVSEVSDGDDGGGGDRKMPPENASSIAGGNSDRKKRSATPDDDHDDDEGGGAFEEERKPGRGGAGAQLLLEDAILSGVGRATGEDASVCLGVGDDDGGDGVGEVGDGDTAAKGEEEGGRRVVLSVAPSALRRGTTASAAAPTRQSAATAHERPAAAAAAAPATERRQPAIEETLAYIRRAVGGDEYDAVNPSRHFDDSDFDGISIGGGGATASRARTRDVSLPGAWEVTGPARAGGSSSAYGRSAGYLVGPAARSGIGGGTGRGRDVSHLGAPTSLGPSPGELSSTGGGDSGGRGRGNGDDGVVHIVADAEAAPPSPSASAVVSSFLSSSGAVAAVILEPLFYDDEAGSGCQSQVPPPAADQDKRRRWWRRRNVLPVAVGLIVLLGVTLGLGLGLTRSGRKQEEGNSDSAASENAPPSNHSGRYVAFRDILYPLRDPDHTAARVLEDPSSPQHRALAWLADNDTISLDPDAAARARQRYALATFFYATGGAGWTQGCHFLSGGHECDWNDGEIGVFCDGSGGRDKEGEGISSEVVNFLDLRVNNLNGTLPDEVFWLTNLTKVVLGMNKLSGQIPSAIGHLTKLSFLDMWMNDLSGSISPDIGRLSMLNVLYLGTNHLTGTVPSALRNLTQIRALQFATNALTGTIGGWFGDLINLEVLGLYTNNLHGPIPSSIARLPKLEQLYLNSNDFDSLPIFPGAFPSLRTLIGWNMNLSGTLPEAISSLTNLEDLALRGNRLHGEVPWSALGAMPKLARINLENNELSGTVPGGELGGSSGSLLHLLMGGNRLDGPIRDDLLLHNPDLHVLALQNNRITGTVPSVMGGMEKLWLLDLRSNRLSGGIPEILSNSRELRYLDLSDNRLSGTVPRSLQQMKHLDWFSVARNDLVGDMSFLCGANTTVELFADCAEVSCPCCTICCRDNGDDGCNRVLPDFTIMGHLCYQTLLPVLSERSEHYSDMICHPESLFTQLVHNEHENGGLRERRLRARSKEKVSSSSISAS